MVLYDYARFRAINLPQRCLYWHMSVCVTCATTGRCLNIQKFFFNEKIEITVNSYMVEKNGVILKFTTQSPQFMGGEGPLHRKEG